MKKIIAIILVMCMVITGCTKNKPEMPYGKVVKQYYLSQDMGITLDPKLALEDRANRTIIVADPNFVNEQQLILLAKYFYAIQHNDLALFKEIMLPMFEAYIQADTEATNFTIADWLQMLYDYAFEMAGGEFKFFEVEVLTFDDKDMTGKVGTMLDDLYKIIDFEIAYNEMNGLTE